MPLLQYKCKTCGKKFEELVRVYTDKVVCPDCGGETERDYSGTMYSATGTALAAQAEKTLTPQFRKGRAKV